MRQGQPQIAEHVNRNRILSVRHTVPLSIDAEDDVDAVPEPGPEMDLLPAIGVVVRRCYFRTSVQSNSSELPIHEIVRDKNTQTSIKWFRLWQSALSSHVVTPAILSHAAHL